MTEVMKGLGLRDAFIRGFNAMVEGQDALINGILQAVNIKVDEKGVEAAAATGIGMATSPGPDQSEVVELNFDRPFLYVIRGDLHGNHPLHGNGDRILTTTSTIIMCGVHNSEASLPARVRVPRHAF